MQNLNPSLMQPSLRMSAIDFACLDGATQLNVAHRLMGSESMVKEWERLCGKELRQIRDAVKTGLQPRQSLIRSNRDCIKTKLSGEKFARNFAQCFLLKTQPKDIPQNRYKKIARYFSDLSRFQIADDSGVKRLIYKPPLKSHKSKLGTPRSRTPRTIGVFHRPERHAVLAGSGRHGDVVYP